MTAKKTKRGSGKAKVATSKKKTTKTKTTNKSASKRKTGAVKKKEQAKVATKKTAVPKYVANDLKRWVCVVSEALKKIES